MKHLLTALLALGIVPAAACKSHAHAAEPPERVVTIALTGLK